MDLFGIATSSHTELFGFFHAKHLSVALDQGLVMLGFPDAKGEDFAIFDLDGHLNRSAGDLM